jgi:hypothetical protein
MSGVHCKVLWCMLQYQPQLKTVNMKEDYYEIRISFQLSAEAFLRNDLRCGAVPVYDRLWW